jgi:hypothetical protein
MSRIAVIAWGSLLWDLDDLAPKVRGAWHVARGPRLPFEFSRVSDKRKRALVVVIDHEHGVECSTSFIESTHTDLDAAVDDLAARERAPRERIGHCTVDDDGPSPHFSSSLCPAPAQNGDRQGERRRAYREYGQAARRSLLPFSAGPSGRVVAAAYGHDTLFASRTRIRLATTRRRAQGA